MSMFNGKYTSVEEIILSVYRDMGMNDMINISDAVEWAGEAIELINAPLYLEEKVKVLLVDCYKAKIPCDLHYINSISGRIDPSATEVDSCSFVREDFIQMRYSTDVYHHFAKDNQDCYCNSSFTYKVNDNYINPSFEEGFLLVSYKAIPTDEKGYPKIPDNIKFKKAVRLSIMEKLAFIKNMSGKLSDRAYSKIEADYLFSVGQAQSEGHKPGLDMMESIKNNWIRLIPKINQHSDGFRSSGEREQRIIHNASNTTRISSSEATYFYTR